ncbi:hypothetical protein D3C71_809740 [compost metagenome]
MTSKAEFERLLDVYGFRCERFGQDLSTHARAQVVAAFASQASAPVAGEADQDEMERRGWVNVGYKHDLEKARRAISFCNIPGFDTMSLDNAIYWLRAKVDDAAPQASEAVRGYTLDEVFGPLEALEIARSALMEIADLADVEADQRGVIVNQALTKIDNLTAAARPAQPGAQKNGGSDAK